MTRKIVVVLALTVGCGLVRADRDPKAFSDAVGWAAVRPGGRGGQILRVTNLKADGPGSLAEAIRTKGPRIVVFEVGGVIDLNGKRLGIREPYLTVAGQTAPSPGITLIRGGIGIGAHDVILQHLRVRVGEAGHAKKSGWEVDGIATAGANACNIIVDHCSCAWATDENLSASGPRFEGDGVEQWRDNTSHNITFSHCIIAEGLNESTHAKGRHSKGTLIHDNCTNIAIVGNLYAHNVNRNPLFKGGASGVVVNNYIYDPYSRAIHYALVTSEWGDRPRQAGRLAIVGNVFQHGLSTRDDAVFYQCRAGNECEVFLSDNRMFDIKGNALEATAVGGRDTSNELHRVTTPPLWPDGLKALPAAEVERQVLDNAGARPWDRDEVDRRIVQQVRSKTGGFVDSEREVGGYPAPTPTRAPFDSTQWNLDDMTRKTEPADSKLRVVIETDAPGGDPDDEGSLVRFFLYLNEWDVEGLIGTRAAKHSRLKVSGKQRIGQYIDDYEAVVENLTTHAEGYPTPSSLRDITKQCYEGNEGRDYVIRVVDRDDPRPIWYLNWGTNEEDDKPTALREALEYVKKTRSDAEYERFIGKIHYVGVDRQGHLGSYTQDVPFYMDTFFPNMDGGRWYHRWRPLTQRAGGFDVKRDIQTGHGPLCAEYTIQKEGDTPTFTHLIPNGLNVPMRPAWGGWSGRYSFNEDLGLWWCDQRDTWRGTTNRDNTLKRWVVHIQNDFKARADWCVTEVFDKANHPPVPVLQGSTGRSVVSLDASAGEAMELSAADSSDPDGDALTYRWTYYPEAGSYVGPIDLDHAESQSCTVHIPSDVSGKTIHIILEVTDAGTPALMRYRRAVLRGL